jgi:hypothetical protein
MYSINRQVAIIKPKEPYLNWINSLPDAGKSFELEGLSSDCTALLIPHFDDDDDSMKFIKGIYRKIFEIELDSWSTDNNTWPKKRSYALFLEWFRVEFHSEVFDFVKEL